MPKTLFFEARRKGRVLLPKRFLAMLPRRLCLASSVQYVASLEAVKKQLEDSGRTAVLKKPRHAAYRGQVLGCSLDAFALCPGRPAAALYIGDGRFHPLALVDSPGLEIFFYDPLGRTFGRISEKEKQKARQRQDYLEKRFLSSGEIGILVSAKPGQERLADALRLKEVLLARGRSAYILVSNDIDMKGLPDWSFIQCFVNTACPRLADDADSSVPVIGVDRALQFLAKQG